MTNPVMQDPQLLGRMIEIDRDAELPVYLQIANTFIRNIRWGRLRRGLKLPGSRKVAHLLGINRMTMVAAYDELEAQGWIERIPRKGTFVNRELPTIKPQKISGEKEIGQFPRKPLFSIYENRTVPYRPSNVDTSGKLIINDGFPDIRLAPVQALLRAMRTLYRRATFGKYLNHGGSQGTPALCNILAAHLNDTRGLPISTKNIMITRGAQMGFYLATSLLLQPGDHVIVGEPGYFGANRTFQQQGAVLNRVPVDEYGIDVDSVEKVCKEKKVKLLYVIPHHHHPTTVTLTPERRLRLLELAAIHKFAIIEDDYDYDFHYASSPMLPMASLDELGSVIYVGTLTKTLAPGIRIGFITGAETFIQAASDLRRIIDWQGDSLMEAAVAELYKDGAIARHIRKSVKLYCERRDHFCHLLETAIGERVSFRVPEGGMSVWTKFIDVDLKKISRQASQKGLVVSNGKEYNTHTKNYNAARLGFASLNLKEQEKAIGILAKCLKE